MASDKEILQTFLDGQLKPDLIKSYRDLGLKASGLWAESLQSFVDKTKKGFRFGMEGQHYTYYMYNGRGKNKDQSPDAIKRWVGWAGSTFLAQWVKDKGIVANPFAVARKIATKGIPVPNRFNRGTLLDFVNEDYFSEVVKKITDKKIEKLQSDVIKAYKV